MRWQFDDFELDDATGELWHRGDAVALPPQPARLLCLLVTAAPRLVERHELRRHLWGDDFLDWESGLHQTIRKIRRTLGDSATAPRYVETVPRRGYRFIAALETVEPPDSAPATSPGALPATPPAVVRRAPRTASSARLLVALVAVSLAAGLVIGSRETASPHSPRGGAPRLQAEPPAAERVSSEHRFHSEHLSAERLSAERLSAERLHAEGLHLLSSGRIDDAEERLLRAASLDRSWAAPWSALAELELARPLDGNVDRARGHLEKALSRDREDRRAWQQLARLRLWREWDWVGGRAALEQALATHAGDAGLWQLLAALETVEGHETEALAAARRALALDPLSTTLRVDLGWTLYYFDHAAEALAECERSLELEPANVSALHCAVQAAVLLGDHGRASTLLGGDAEHGSTVAGFFRRQLEQGAPNCAEAAADATPLLILGRPEEAMRALLGSLDGGKGWALPFALADPLLAPLRRHADYPRLVRAVGLSNTDEHPGDDAARRGLL